MYGMYGLVHPTYAYMPKELATDYRYGSYLVSGTAHRLHSIRYQVVASRYRVGVNAADARAQSPRDVA